MKYAPDYPPGLPCEEYPICHQSPSWHGFTSGLDDEEERLAPDVEYAERRRYEALDYDKEGNYTGPTPLPSWYDPWYQ